ncbi:hypothetical protein FT663_03692 [Candidozyma haemuli var. vulneris]|nr:hypothetical protein FT662_03828 [[Candida] haemuloni var. vulneris]KAF3989232.1 hypothetical protein FT663_03692 [[Candida] haemuloni var. vulneris]
MSSLPPKPPATYQKENNEKQPESQEKQINLPEQQVPKLHKTKEYLQKKWRDNANWFPATINISLVLVCFALQLSLCFPTIPSSIVKYSFEDSGDWYDFSRFLVKSFEHASPGSTGKMTEFIPEKWPLGKTEYYFGYFGYCRRSEKMPTVCHGSMESPLKAIVHDIGTVLAEGMETNERKKKQIVLSWENAVDNALRSAKEAIRSITSGARFLNATQERDIDYTTIDVVDEFSWDIPSEGAIVMSVFVSVWSLVPILTSIVPPYMDPVMPFGMAGWVLLFLPQIILSALMHGKESGALVRSQFMGYILVTVSCFPLMLVSLGFWALRKRS